MDRAALDTYIETNISDKTDPNTVTPEDVGNTDKQVADYVDAHEAVVIHDSQATTNILTASNTDFDYQLDFWRSGNTIHVNGQITNSTLGTLTPRDIATVATDWQSAINPAIFVCTSANGDEVMRINVTDTKFTLAVTCTHQNAVAVNFSYPAAN